MSLSSKAILKPQNQNYVLIENEETGLSSLSIDVEGINIVKQKFDNPKDRIPFVREEKTYGMNKAVDHLIFRNNDDGWEIHLIEMKSSVGYDTWRAIRQKVRASYFKAMSLAAHLGIDIVNVNAYITYEKENIMMPIADAKMKYARLGEKTNDFRKEWTSREMTFAFGNDKLVLSHTPIQMQRSSDGSKLEGEYQL